jgi:SAM-dependent methyltransferase
MPIERSALSKPYNWLIHHYTTKAIKTRAHYLKGKVLDVGCGTQPYRDFITPYCDTYIGIDYSKHASSLKKPDISADAHFLPFAPESFDSLVAFQVMEHLPNPQIFLNEARRVVKPGGYILITTPFMWGEHEQPYDYYRYTRYGLEYLAKFADLECIEIVADTGFWATSILQFNYWSRRFDKYLLFRPFLRVLWLNQYLGLFWGRFDHEITQTATFTTLLRKRS